MSKSHCLPLGAPMRRLMNAHYYSDSDKEEEELTDNGGGGGVHDTKDEFDSDDEILGTAGISSGRILTINRLPVHTPRKRGKEAKPVDQLDVKTGALLRRYESQKDACDMMKASTLYISECCRGLRSDCFGFKWRFAENCPPEDKGKTATGGPWVPMGELLAIKNKYKLNFGVKYVKLEDGSFVVPRKLARAARAKADGEGAAAESDDELLGEYEEGDGGAAARRRSRARPVEQMDIETGKVLRRYISQQEAAATMKVNQINISQACRGSRPDAYGFRWRNIDEEVYEMDESKFMPVAELLKIKCRYDEELSKAALRTVEQFDLVTGAVLRRYENTEAACKLSGASVKQLTKALQAGVHEVHGYGWRLYTGPNIDLEEDNKQAGRMELRDVVASLRDNKRRARRETWATADDNSDGDIDEMEDGSTAAAAAAAAAEERQDWATRPVHQLDLTSRAVVAVHSNQAEAAAAVKGMETFISKCLRGIVDEAYGFGWKFAPVESAVMAEAGETEVAGGHTEGGDQDDEKMEEEEDDDAPPPNKRARI